MKTRAITVLLLAVVTAGCFRAERTNPMDPEGPGVSNAGIRALSITPVMIGPSVASNGNPTNRFMAFNIFPGGGGMNSIRNWGFGKQYFVQSDHNGSGFVSVNVYIMGQFGTSYRATNLTITNHSYGVMRLMEYAGGSRILVSTASNVLGAFTMDFTPDGTVVLPPLVGGQNHHLPSLRAYGNDLFILGGDQAFRVTRGEAGGPSTLMWSNQLPAGASFFGDDRIAWNGQGKVVVLQKNNLSIPRVWVLDANTGAVVSGPSTNIGGVGSTNVLWVDRTKISSVEGWNGTFLFVGTDPGTAGNNSVRPRFLDLPGGVGVATERWASPPFGTSSYFMNAEGGILFGAGGLVAQYQMDNNMGSLAFYQYVP